jgi:hypothetical protein
MGFRKVHFAPSISKLLASSAVETLRSPFLDYLFWRSKKGNWLSGHTRPSGSKITTTLHHTTRKKPTKHTSHAWAQNPCPPYAISHTFNRLKAIYKASCASGCITLIRKLPGKPNDVVSRNLIPSSRNFLNNSALSIRLDNGGIAQ